METGGFSASPDREVEKKSGFRGVNASPGSNDRLREMAQEVTDLRMQNQDQEKKIQELERQNKALTQDKDRLQANLDQVNQQLKDANNNLAQNQAEINTLKTERDNLASQISTLQQENEDL
mmetsp:Transcript_16261/g.13899  ORF Transcript_16261/g.13899 Transcript_16261/m.13899 type:complete len:121 (-) Transcript_16261:1763-2125(-)